MKGVECDYCSKAGTCEVDADGAKYCLPCWEEYDKTAARTAAATSRRLRAESRESVPRGESAKASLMALRHRLLKLLTSTPNGINLDSLPALLCPGRLREVTTSAQS